MATGLTSCISAAPNVTMKAISMRPTILMATWTCMP
ncbi:hypothetical protein EVA_19276 [gut metagenome]|uniref:Uncharacterized protein n=1 Tax=gut metagenome TaxID=749906 RepID=J9FCK6_9ZZZZ